MQMSATSIIRLAFRAFYDLLFLLLLLLFLLLFKDFIYLFEREESRGEEEADSPLSMEPSTGLDSRTMTEPKTSP